MNRCYGLQVKQVRGGMMKTVALVIMAGGLILMGGQAQAADALDSKTLTLETTINNPSCTLSLAQIQGGGTVTGTAVSYETVQWLPLVAALQGNGVYGLPSLKLQVTCDATLGGVSSTGQVSFTGNAGNCINNPSTYLFCGTGTTAEGVGFVFKPGKGTVTWGGVDDAPVETGDQTDALPQGSATVKDTVVSAIDVGVGISAARSAGEVKPGYLATTVGFDLTWK